MKSKNLLLIFIRNPKLGQVKTRLAKDIGAVNALNIYHFLSSHTCKITQQVVHCDKQVWYSEFIDKDDIWSSETFEKQVQKGNNLGERLQNAFEEGFTKGYEKIIVIGSDLFEIHELEIQESFDILNTKEAVIGPAKDGGYYLIGFSKCMPSDIFTGISWGENSVLQETKKRLIGTKYQELALKNDIDYLEDIINIPEFQCFLKK